MTLQPSAATLNTHLTRLACALILVATAVLDVSMAASLLNLAQSSLAVEFYTAAYLYLPAALALNLVGLGAAVACFLDQQ